jgi:hypothetical protein
MRTRTGWSLICMLTLLACVLFAGENSAADGTGLALPSLNGELFSGLGQGVSLLDPQRLQMSQGYSLMYSSGGRSRDLVGLYQNWLSYRFSPRLNVRVNMGYFHRPVAALSNTSTVHKQALSTAFQVDFRPLDNVFIQLNFQSRPVTDYRDSLWRFRGGWSSTGD